MFSEEARVHLRDCYDHTVQAIDFVETYRELGSDLMDVYLSAVSNRMNEVMKVLTIITTIFVPAGLIAGIYGMNFHTENSPY
ncbi:CorA family divalent cation transporter, partial [Acinetobacter baumannii]